MKMIYRDRCSPARDEFYTRKEDIEAMLPEWDLSDKIVYCCADSEESEFVKYFKQPGKCKEWKQGLGTVLKQKYSSTVS